MEYRRAWRPGGWYFFTLVTYKRLPILTVPENVSRLRMSFHHVMQKRPFEIDGIVVLPDHVHCIWRLPEEDADFATRWRLIKHFFSRSCFVGKMGKASPALVEWADHAHQTTADEKQSNSRKGKRERAVWQRRYWEHLIRNEEDWRRHMDYIHYNPVRHGLASVPAEWPYSSFKQCVEKGWYSVEWGSSEPKTIAEMDFE